ncbi:MAG: T9SS type A sorting domain-containing protein [Bacteroidota bacterium]
MMNRLIIAAFLMLIFSSSIYSQEWAPIGAKWYYTYVPEYVLGLDPRVETVEVVGDTTVLGKPCRVLKANVGLNLGLICDGSRFMYNENDSVFYYDAVENKFNLLYVFNASIGQSWSVPLCYNQDFGYGASLGVTVEDKYITTFDSTEVMTYKVNWSFYFNPTPYDTIIYENIGSAASMYMMGVSATVHSGIRGLRCYESPETGLINFLGEPCDQIVSAQEELSENSIIEIYPVPVSDLLKYKIKDSSLNGKNMVRIFNATGHLIFERENIITGAEQVLSVSGLPVGVYLLQFVNGEKIITTKRFVVAR